VKTHNNPVTYFIGCLLFIVILVPQQAEAQSDIYAYRVAKSSANIQDMMWASNSTTFSYIEQNLDVPLTDDDITRGVILTQPFWKSFDINTGLLNASKVWTLYPTLTTEQLNVLMPLGFVYADPNQVNIVYTRHTPENSDIPYPLTIANLSQTSFASRDINISSPTDPSSLIVLWSDTGNSAVISYLNYYAEPIVEYVNIPVGSDIEGAIFDRFDFVIDGQSYTTFDQLTDKPYDISSDGQDVLLAGRAFEAGRSLNSSIPHPIVWHTDMPKTSIVLNQFDGREITAASFSLIIANKFYSLVMMG
jgi:hypothetical protein